MISDESAQIVATARLLIARLGPSATMGGLFRAFEQEGFEVGYKQLNRLVRMFDLLPARPIRGK